MAEGIIFRLTVRDLRKRLKMAGFRGNIQALSALGDFHDSDVLCAALFCSRTTGHHVYINTQVNCDHHHLTVDIMDLVNAYENDHLDRGWERLPNGDARTGIATGANAWKAGIPASDCAPNPYRTGS